MIKLYGKTFEAFLSEGRQVNLANALKAKQSVPDKVLLWLETKLRDTAVPHLPRLSGQQSRWNT